MSSSKRWNLKNRLIMMTNKGGCGCGPKATDVIEPNVKSKPSISDDQKGQSATSSAVGDAHTSTTVDDMSSPHLCPENHQGCPKIHDSLAVVQDSDDPYRDFRQSMLQMIMEKEMYSGNDLQQLLHCFLDLNPPHHHGVIVQAFMEIWNGGAAVAPPAR